MRVSPKNISFTATQFLKRRALELWGFLCIVGGGMLWVMVGSYDAYDPSYNTAIHGPVNNWVGPKGAIIADLLHQGCGTGSYAFIGMGLTYGFMRLYHIPLFAFPLRFMAFCLFLLSHCFLFHLLLNKGGLLGFVVHEMVKPFNIHKAYLITGGLILCFTSFPWAYGPKNFLSYIRLYYARGGIKLVPTLHTIIHHMKKLVPLTHATTPRQEPTFHENEQDEHDEQDNSISSDPIPISQPRKKRSTPLKSLQKVFTLNDQNKYQLPPLNLLADPPTDAIERESDSVLQARALELKKVLDDFSVKGTITKVRSGPVVTLFELVPAPGVKASRIIGLADDIARSMCALSARIAVIPGKNALGIELPNTTREMVLLKELLACKEFSTTPTKLSLILGKDIAGGPVIADLARMPHLLVAGTTGSGKSVGINTMILSLLYRLSPEKCRFLMIDPKMLELSVYNGIPHLLSPVVTDPKKAIYALKWTVREMEDRYRMMSHLGVRNIEGYNQRLIEAKKRGEAISRQVQTGFDPHSGEPIYENQNLNTIPLPYIVVVVDEMADLMMVAGKEIEAAVMRLAQMARAAGIHLIMATQRPSVDVITGTIKANFPTRISFQVTSKFDSRTILGEQGSEQLLGRGDMLYMEPGGKIQRVHGPFVSDEEVFDIVSFLKSQGEPQYVDSITDDAADSINTYGEEEESKGDQLYRQAVEIVIREQKASTSFVQRHLQIGYNRAARIIEQMEKEGLISAANHVGKREVLQRAS